MMVEGLHPARRHGRDNDPCRSHEENLALYHDGELEGEALLRLEDHLEQCEACRSELRALAHLDHGLQAIELSDRTPSSMEPHWLIQVISLAAALLLIGLVVGLLQRSERIDQGTQKIGSDVGTVEVGPHSVVVTLTAQDRRIDSAQYEVDGLLSSLGSVDGGAEDDVGNLARRLSAIKAQLRALDQENEGLFRESLIAVDSD